MLTCIFKIIYITSLRPTDAAQLQKKSKRAKQYGMIILTGAFSPNGQMQKVSKSDYLPTVLVAWPAVDCRHQEPRGEAEEDLPMATGVFSDATADAI